MRIRLSFIGVLFCLVGPLHSADAAERWFE